MNTIKHSFLRILALSTLGLALTGGAAFAGNDCSPDIKVSNFHTSTTSVKVKKLQYRFEGNSTWHDEGVNDVVLTKNRATTYKTQRLGSASRGTKLIFRAVYEEDTGKGFGGERNSGESSSRVCDKGVLYSVSIK